MVQRKSANAVRRRVWRVSETAPLGEFVYPDELPARLAIGSRGPRRQFVGVDELAQRGRFGDAPDAPADRICTLPLNHFEAPT